MLKKENRFYLFIFIISMLLLTLWVIFVPTKPFSDFQYYHDVALQISRGGQWGNTYTSVGYSIVLGFLYWLFSPNIWVGKLFNVILALSNLLFFYAILKKLQISEKEKKILFILFAFYPANIFYSSILATELLFTTLMLFITFICFSNIKGKYILMGVLIGLNTMIKPFFIAFFIVIFFTELLSHKKLGRAFQGAVIVLLVACIVITPWVYRNTKLMGQFTYVSNNSGIVLYINNNSQNKFGRWMPASEVENSIVNTSEYTHANMTQRNKMLSNAAKQWISHHPVEFVVLGLKRLINTYFTSDDITYSLNGAGINHIIEWLCILIYTVLRFFIFIPAVFYILYYTAQFLGKLYRGDSIPMVGVSVYALLTFYMFTGIYFLTEGQARYSFPVTFIILYFFYACLNQLSQKLCRKVRNI